MQNLLLKTIIVFFGIAIYSGCGEKTDKSKVITEKKTEQKQEEKDQKSADSTDKVKKYASQSEDEQMSKNITNFLINDYLRKDIEVITDEDRKFQMYKIDLNSDGKEEYFVRLMGAYFCGSGGCTFLLLDRYSEVITKFTVTDAPIYISPEKENGWDILYLEHGGKYRKAAFNYKTYPANPSLLPASDFKPGEKDQVLFSDEKNPCKTYVY